MAQDYLAAQKAIDGLRLSFKNKKKPKPAVEQLHPVPQPAAACDCCGKEDAQSQLTAIESGQHLCQTCLSELRQFATVS